MDLTKTPQWKAVGGLSRPSKMPCFSYSIPASNCITGGKLFNVANSVCENCYARGGRYPMKNVQNALHRRMNSLADPFWVDNMVYLIKNAKQKFFRWHDSGDLQGEWHLNKIVEVARQCPSVKFWLPTKEFRMVSDWQKANGAFPDNLTVRMSAPMKEHRVHPKFGPSSMVVKDPSKNPNTFTLCKAYERQGKCGNCRACWNKSVPVVAYKEH